jgi:hypothetical protein
MKAYLALRDGVHYRREVFAAGLEALGYTVIHGLTYAPRPHDLLVIWNRYRENATAADRFEQSNNRVVVAENGYLGNDFAQDRWYALACNQHNGAGTFRVGEGARWDSLGVELAPWRADGKEVVILPQRGIGPPGVAMPLDWPERTRDALRAHGIKCRIRPHPGVRQCTPLQDDLANASAVATWGSGAAIKALAWGIPVYADFRYWIAAPAALSVTELVRGHPPLRCDHARLAVFRRMAWAMWRMKEIETGQAFRWLLNT